MIHDEFLEDGRYTEVICDECGQDIQNCEFYFSDDEHEHLCTDCFARLHGKSVENLKMDYIAGARPRHNPFRDRFTLFGI